MIPGALLMVAAAVGIVAARTPGGFGATLWIAAGAAVLCAFAVKDRK